MNGAVYGLVRSALAGWHVGVLPQAPSWNVSWTVGLAAGPVPVVIVTSPAASLALLVTASDAPVPQPVSTKSPDTSIVPVLLYRVALVVPADVTLVAKR